MNGPEHYREAERLLRTHTRYFNGGQTREEHPPSEVNVARAQAHATLAHAAATIEQASVLVELARANDRDTGITDAWWEVLR